MNGMYIGLYLALQIGLGLYLSKFIKNESDFFLGGRKIPTFAIAFSIFATWFGAETCIGSSAAVFESGLAGSKAEPFGYGLCLVLTALFIAPNIWNEKYTTMGDFIKDKFGVTTERLFVWIIFPSSLIWAAAQVKAFGQVLSVTTPLDIFWGTTIATAFVIVYTLLGGFLGDVVTDVLQGFILAIGLVAILYFGLTENHVSLAKIPMEKLSFVAANESFLERLDSWLIPIFGSLVAQELIARVLSAKDASQAVRSTYGGTVLYLIFGSIPIILGLVGSQLNLQLEDSEQFLPTLANKVLPPWLFIIFTGALISAILSTIDSILLAISALISHNFIAPILKITEQKKKVLSARIVLVISGMIAYILALNGESVYKMVETSSSFGTSGILVITVGGILSKKTNGKIASATLLFGILLSIIFDIILELPAAFGLNLLCVGIFYILATQLSSQKELSKLPTR